MDLGADARIFRLVNLHGHPAFNVLPLWLPPASHAQPERGRPTGTEPYANRYEWNTAQLGPLEYRRIVSSPKTILNATLGEGPDMVKWAEAMSVLGGQTTLEGDGVSSPETDYTLARNVDFGAFCHAGEPCADTVVSRVSGIRDEPLTGTSHLALRFDMMTGATTSYLVHLAEGVRDAERPSGDTNSSRDEFTHLAELGLLTEQTVILHGVALERDDFRLLRLAPSARARSSTS